jgi:transcription antitermination factor NusG
MTNWYAVYTRPRCEKKVTENLLKKKIQAYCPIINMPRQWMGMKALQMPLFKSQVFVKINEPQLEEIKQIDGVINLVYWLGTPAIIRDIEIEMMMRFLKEHDHVQLERISVDPKAIVKISYEPLPELENQMTSEKQQIVKLSLPTLGYAIIAHTKIEEIHIIQHDSIKSAKFPFDIQPNYH